MSKGRDDPDLNGEGCAATRPAFCDTGARAMPAGANVCGGGDD